MFSRVYRARFRPEESDTVIRVAQESIPIHQALPGFRRLTYLYDRTSGLALAIELFETREHAEATLRDAKVQKVIDDFLRYAVEGEDMVAPLGQDSELPMFEVIAEG